MTDVETNRFERRVYYLQFPRRGAMPLRELIEAPASRGRKTDGKAYRHETLLWLLGEGKAELRKLE